MVTQRTCIVSRQPMEKDVLLRFVAGPQDRVYPDLKENLPGRGVWVEAKRASVTRAVEKNLFSRSLKQQVAADPDLPDLVGRLLGERALMALAMARKAGAVVTGFTKADAAIRSNRVAVLVHAGDAAADGRRKLAQAVAMLQHLERDDLLVCDCWVSEQLAKALGGDNVMHAAVLSGGAAANLVRAIRRWEAYEERDVLRPGFAGVRSAQE